MVDSSQPFDCDFSQLEEAVVIIYMLLYYQHGRFRFKSSCLLALYRSHSLFNAVKMLFLSLSHLELLI